MFKISFKGPSLDQLLRWQKFCLFLAIVLVPFRPPIYTNTLLGSFSHYGHTSFLPILIGLILAAVCYVKTGNTRKILVPAIIFAFLYMLMIAVVSIHALVVFDGYTERVLGVTPKIQIVRDYLAQLGIVNEKYAYQVIIFVKDIRNGLTELIACFGFVAWTASLYVKEKRKIFDIVQKAILLDFILLAPYVATEIFHLYGCRGATEILKSINPLFYVPGSNTGWYPPLVSWHQVRAIWTEPAFFSIWLAFAAPFLFHWAIKSGGTNLKAIVGRGCLFFVVFSVWFMTYARTSVYLAFVSAIVSFGIALYLRSKESRIHGVLLIVAFAMAFSFVSSFGPQDIARWKQKPVVTESASSPRGTKVVSPKENLRNTESNFIKDTVKSSISVNSRSTPIRLQYWTARLHVFMDYPLLGCGDSFQSLYEARKYSIFGPSLMPELKNRLKWIESKGLFNAGFGENGLCITGMLACRGLVGTLAYAIPILFFFFLLLKSIHREQNREEKKIALCLFCSTSVVALTAFVQGLSFLDFWCSCGVGVGWILYQRVRMKDRIGLHGDFRNP